MEEEEVIVLTGPETRREQIFKKPRSITITQGDYWSYSSKRVTVLKPKLWLETEPPEELRLTIAFIID